MGVNITATGTKETCTVSVHSHRPVVKGMSSHYSGLPDFLYRISQIRRRVGR